MVQAWAVLSVTRGNLNIVPLVWGRLGRSNVITQLECGRESMINSLAPSEKPVGTLMTSAIRSLLFSIR